MKPILRTVVAVLLCIAVLGVDRPAQAQGKSEEAKQAAIAKLTEKLLARGEVNVIVGLPLAGGFAQEKGLSIARIAGQRSAIAAARLSLLAELQGLGAREYASWETLPYVALNVGLPALQHLASSPNVDSIQEDSLANPGLASSTALIGSDITVASGFRGDNWAVVILDTGIDTDHPFFSGRVVWQACFSNGAGGGATLCPGGANTQTGPGAAEVTGAGGAPIPACDDGTGGQICDHGVHVAGIAAGENTGPPEDYDGVAPGAFIIPIQVFTRFTAAADCAPNPAPCVSSYASDQISALNYVNTTLVPLWDIASVNMSLGGDQHTAPCDGDARKAPIDALLLSGVATVIAAGNNGWTDTISEPGCISTAVTVGGVTDADAVIFNMGNVVDILAPGQFVRSSVPNDAFGSKSGTSMATPHVTGAFAVMRAILGADPSVGDILTLLQNSGPLITDTRPANNPGGTGSGTLTGYVKPRLQLDAAVAEVLPADLRVVKDCKPDSPFPAGTTAICTIFVDNIGPAPAINVTLIDELLSNGTFNIDPVTTDAGTCTVTPNPQIGAGTVTCELGNLAADGRVTIVVPIRASTPQNVSDTASASSETDDPDASNNIATDVLNFLGSANLSLTKSDAPDPVIAGQTLTYTLTVTNLGPSPAPNVVVEEFLPVQVTVISATPSVGSCSGTTVPGDPSQPLTCNLGTLANGGAASVTIVVRVKSDTPHGTILINNAAVHSDAADPTNTNNIDTSSTTVHAEADLSISKTDSPDPVSAGAALTYVLTVTNNGPSWARAVVVSDTLPAQLSFVGATISGGSGSCATVAGPGITVQCNLGDVPDGGVRTVTIQSVVAASVPNGFIINNTATVASATTDPTAANNLDTEPTTVQTRADLWLDKTGVQLTGNPSRTIRYTLTVYNKAGCEADDALSCGAGGPSDAQNVVVTDTLPLDPKKLKVVFVSQGCTYNEAAHNVVCTVAGGVLPAGQFASFIIDVQIAGSVGSVTNIAEVTSTTVDPVAPNNRDVLQMVIKGGSSRP